VLRFSSVSVPAFRLRQRQVHSVVQSRRSRFGGRQRQTLTIEGWNGTNRLLKETGTLSAFSPLDFSAPALGIDLLVLRTYVMFNGQSTRPLQWMMDDFQYGIVTEVGPLLQLGAGLLMLFAF